MSVSAVTSSSITVQWGAVDCIHRNGDITGYSVQYGVVGSGSTQTVSVSGGSVNEATISSLMSSTTYSIQVAAVNSAGTGRYSVANDAKTNGKQMDLRHCSTCSVCTAHNICMRILAGPGSCCHTVTECTVKLMKISAIVCSTLHIYNDVPGL